MCRRKGFVKVEEDIIEQEKLEEKLFQTQKLESIGILASGIAHDFNNILTAILSNVSLAKMSVRPGNKVFKRLTTVEKAAFRAQSLAQQLLTFPKDGKPVKRPVSLKELIKESAGFVLRGSNVKCEYFIARDLWPVEVDEGQISQVINNLIINADQAMPEGGIIEVHARNITAGTEGVLPVKEGKHVRLSVKDQGHGIPGEHLPRIFEPYFTTKKRGSGLGLATTYAIVKRHDGHITVESGVTGGTTFHVYLPAVERVPAKKHREEGDPGAKGMILVMDDEADIRCSLGDILAHFGYEVDFAEDGSQVIELYREALASGTPFDAVIVDLTVPGSIGGKKVVERLRRIDPDVKAIVSSGYSNDPVISGFRKYGFRGVITKPYQIGELSLVLQRVLKSEPQ